MHVVLGLIIAAVVAYTVYRVFFMRPAPPSITPTHRSDRAFAFLSNGLLFFREQGGAVQQLHSAYAQESADRRERARGRHGWKKGTSFGVAAGGGMRDFEPADKPVLATSAVYEAGGNLLYFLRDDNVGGLFRREAASGNEIRVLLRQNLNLSDLSLSPDGARVAASSQSSDGVANIILLDIDGNNLREATGGDTVDSAPAWIPGVANRLLFQSAGLARNQQGYVVAQGPASLQMLDMESGRVSPVLENPAFDYLRPRVDPAGNLLFIRRPYEMPRMGLGNVILDTLLFPFRLLRAVFHYLNFFSLMYSRKPLTSASGPATQADLKDILLQGRRIDAQKALRSANLVQGVPSLVPESWALVSRTREGVDTVLATHVASYDISSAGTIVYSNGCGVFILEQGGTPSLAVTNELIADVVAATV